MAIIKDIERRDSRARVDELVAAMDVILQGILDYLDDEVPLDYYTPIAPISRELGLRREFVRASLRYMTDLGWARYSNGLWTEDGHPAGAGYQITDLGRIARWEKANG